MTPTSVYVKLVETLYQHAREVKITKTYDDRLQLFHLEDILLLPGEFLAVANLFAGVVKMFTFRDPFGVDTVQASHLPPSLPAYNSVKLFGSKPFN
jgi:hypothetical protein